MSGCIVCGRDLAEEHHIVFRSQNKQMVNIKINKINLCYECHRGDKGPHKCRTTDLKYKRELQVKLINLFKDFVTTDEIKTKLETSESNANKITKTLIRHKEGYLKEDLVRSLMGGKLY